MEKIAIIGLGLIGGSLGLALKRANHPGMEIVGHDAEPTVSRRALARGAVDRAPLRLISAVEDAQMVIIATPVLAIRENLEFLASIVPQGCVITDTGSTKEAIMAWAEEYLPRGVSFIGGHPMAGSEESGIEAADADLFQGARYVLIPGKGASAIAMESMINIVRLIGARPFFVDAFEHDSYVAAVSHLPILLSASLMTATSKSPSWRDIRKLASSGFRDVSRLASGDPIMSLDICLTNRDGIVHWLDQIIEEMQHYRAMVAEGAEELGYALAQAFEARERWLAQVASGRDDEPESGPRALGLGEYIGDMLIGSRLRERYQQVMALYERQGEDRRRRRLRPPPR